MSGKMAVIAVGVLAGAIAAIAHVLFEHTRYRTTNTNATSDSFRVHIDPDCPICLEPMETNGDSCVLLPCGHFMHEDCLRQMSEHRSHSFQTNKCPRCRTPFPL